MPPLFTNYHALLESTRLREKAPYLIVPLIGAIFIIDTLTPRGFADEILYIIPIILTVWLWNRRIVAVGLICSVFTAIGFIVSRPGGSIYTSEANRIVGILLLWVTIMLVNAHQKAVSKLREMHQKLLVTEQNKARFIADTSHELRTPLAIIRSNMDLLDQQRRSGINEEMSREINGEIKHMSELLSELVMLAQPDHAARQELRLKETDMAILLGDLANAYRTLAGTKRITIETDLPHTIIRADVKKISKLFGNLLANAIQYGRRDGWIKVAARTVGNDAVITVSDNGIGIPVSEQSRVFERFYRVRTIDQEGTGLGLSIAKLIANLHGGDITIESREGYGSIFSVKLPL